ncbi:MAG: DUF302 domain-containing protein [Cytophagales bacterium]|nr:DUF302 domain-containing protein [Cytophagales bacterium]
MKYYINKTTDYQFDEAVDKITIALKDVGFGILTEIDMKATMKSKLDIDRRSYKILGACNPEFASKALEMEEKIGILLPCNVTVIEKEDGKVDVSIMDPTVAMSIVENPELEVLAAEVSEKLETVIARI